MALDEYVTGETVTVLVALSKVHDGFLNTGQCCNFFKIMKDSIIILMDCWDYSPNEVTAKDNLRKPMCENINQFVREHYGQIAKVFNTQWGRILNPNIGLRTWGLPVEDTLVLDPILKTIKDNKIKYVWYMGIHWNMCIRHRATGYQPLIEQLTSQGIDVNIYVNQNCTLKHVKQHNRVVREQIPDFASDSVTELKHIEGDTWQILGTRKDWDGTI